MSTRSTTRRAPAPDKVTGAPARPRDPLADEDVYDLPGDDNDLIEIEPDRATNQAGWVATYQAALAAAGKDPRRVDAAGAAALDALVRDVIPLVQRVAVSEVEKRFGTARPGTVVEDCHAAGMLEVLGLAAEFDAARGVAFHRVVSAKYGKVRQAMRDVVDATGGVGPLPSKEHRRVARRARGIRAEQLAHTGREPTTAELAELTLDYYRRQGPERLPDIDPDEATRLAEARLTRSGMRAAIGELGKLLTLTETQRMPDGEAGGWGGVADDLGEDGGVSRPDDRLLTAEQTRELTAFERVATGNLDARQRAAVLARLVGSDDPGEPDGPWTFARVAERYRISTKEMRELVRFARARLAAPHAQFAHLAPDLDGQFETAPAPASSAVAALGRRLGRGPTTSS